MLADVHREQLALLTQTRLAAVNQQVTDVQQLQEPGIGLGLNPAAQVQRLAAEAVKIQIQILPLPISGHALDHQAAMGQEKIEQVRRARGGRLLRQRMP
ncbi:hypothetical protein D3C87_1221260 [compost metagenome]